MLITLLAVFHRVFLPSGDIHPTEPPLPADFRSNQGGGSVGGWVVEVIHDVSDEILERRRREKCRVF